MAAMAAAAVMATATAVTTVTTVTPVTTMAAMAAMADKLNHRRSVSLFVEDVERRQADVGDFLLTESEVIQIIPWNICYRRYG